MKSFLFYLLTSFIFSHFTFVSYAQETGIKYEKEVRIKAKEVPKSALDLIQPILKKSKNTRYYKDYKKEVYFFEVKTTFKKQRISLKFSKDGQLHDIEVVKELKDLPKDIQQKVQEYFQANYKRYKIDRIQIQYNREEEFEDGELEIDDDEEYIEEFLEMDLEDLILKYEIEAEVLKQDKDRGFYEFLFNADGKLEQINKIFRRADDNILY